MRANQGATLVVVTHDPAVAKLADRRIHLSDGRIVREELARTGQSPGSSLGESA